MSKRERTIQVWRRAELMAELFLQELSPKFVARASDQGMVFDYLVGFINRAGGLSTFAVEVKATEKEVGSTFELKAPEFTLLSQSNTPVLLLVVNVKSSSLYFAWPQEHRLKIYQNRMVRLPVTKIDENARQELLLKMRAEPVLAS